jgi:hypothetical protein
MRGPSAAAAIVAAEFDVLRAPVRSVDLLLEIGTSLSWFDSVEDGAEKAAQWDSGFREHLRRQLEASHQHSRPSRFEFNSSSDDYIQGSCFPEPGDSVTLRTAKERRAQYTTLESFLASLTNRQFEAVCKGILDLVGCAPAFLTRRANDQGIDFFGRLSLQGRLAQIYELSGIDRSMSAWLVGQAKHYSGRASTPELPGGADADQGDCAGAGLFDKHGDCGLLAAHQRAGCTGEDNRLGNNQYSVAKPPYGPIE